MIIIIFILNYFLIQKIRITFIKKKLYIYEILIKTNFQNIYYIIQNII